MQRATIVSAVAFRSPSFAAAQSGRSSVFPSSRRFSGTHVNGNAGGFKIHHTTPPEFRPPPPGHREAVLRRTFAGLLLFSAAAYALPWKDWVMRIFYPPDDDDDKDD